MKFYGISGFSRVEATKPCTVKKRASVSEVYTHKTMLQFRLMGLEK